MSYVNNDFSETFTTLCFIYIVPEDQLWEYISLCGLRTHDELNGEHVG